MQHFEKQDLRILYVASQCVFYFMTFRTENFESLVGPTCKYEDKEELMEYFYDILSDKGDDYNKLIDFLAEEVDEAQDNLICGIFSISQLTSGQYAANILIEIEVLDRPTVKMGPTTNMADEF